MSTKQPGVAVVSRSNQRSSLFAFSSAVGEKRPIERSMQLIFRTWLANMKCSISEGSSEHVFLYTHLNQFECNQVSF